MQITQVKIAVKILAEDSADAKTKGAVGSRLMPLADGAQNLGHCVHSIELQVPCRWCENHFAKAKPICPRCGSMYDFTEWMSKNGSVSSPKKAAAAKRNGSLPPKPGKRPRGRPRKAGAVGIKA